MAGNYSESLILFTQILEFLKLDVTFFFNYLLLSWQGGVRSDKYVLEELSKIAKSEAVNLNLMWAIVQETAGLLEPALENYKLAMDSCPD
jgi:hypothetical protein